VIRLEIRRLEQAIHAARIKKLVAVVNADFIGAVRQ
jgi:hypothetical protein